jgi:excisionase family DNA binding protein
MDSGFETRPLVPQASVPGVPPRLLGVREAGAYLGVSPFTIRNMVRDGRLPVVHVPGLTRVLLDIKDLDGLVDAWKRGEASAASPSAGVGGEGRR